MNGKQLYRKNCVAFEMNLQGKSLAILESLYLELNISPENSLETPTDNKQYEAIKAIMNVLEWKLQNEISEEEFSILYREWVKSKNIKEPLDIKYQESFSRDDFFTYVMNSMPDLDSELAQNVSYYLSLLHSEYNAVLIEESFLGFGDNHERIGGVKKNLIDELDNLFNIYDYEGAGHLTYDRILYLFLILYVSSIDIEETCDLFFIKREFQKFLVEIKEFQGKLTLRQFKNYFIQKELLVKTFLQKVRENSVTFAKILNFFISKTTNTPPDPCFPKILDLCFIKTINTTKIVDSCNEESINKIESIRTKHPTLNAFYLYIHESFFREAYFLKISDKNRMPCKLRFYANAPKTFQDFFSPNFLRNNGISFSDDFFSAFTNHVEQTFDDIFGIYKKYFREIDVLDFDHFFKSSGPEKYLNKDLLEDKSSILPFKVHANFVKKPESGNKKVPPAKGFFKYDFDESSIDNFTATENKDYKIKISRVDSVNKSNATSLETPIPSTNEEVQQKRDKITSFYSYPQSNQQINRRNLNFDNFSVNLEGGNRGKADDFVMRNVQKVQKMYSIRGNSNSNRGGEEIIISRNNNADFQRNKQFYRPYTEEPQNDFQKENNSNYTNVLPKPPKRINNNNNIVSDPEKSHGNNQYVVDLSSYNRKTEERDRTFQTMMTERTPIKHRDVPNTTNTKHSQNFSNVSHTQKTTQNNPKTRLNSSERTRNNPNFTAKTDQRSVSPNYYFHKVETFETVINRLNKKGSTAEKPRKPFH